ncbi:magnesium transporter [Pholiota conissans]|uniref:Magnesium transporter n=1 Tax=Pholiota conissans TaxID=109636 RepID=A0A9P6D8A4_9AGAR|nr:magnesium transporter [Pholiota conissans]
MPRENSLDDSEGRSLTPDLDEEEVVSAGAGSPVYSAFPETAQAGPQPLELARIKTGQSKRSLHSRLSKAHPSANVFSAKTTGRPHLPPKQRFQAVVRKVMSLHRGTTLLGAGKVGAEPGIDPSRPAVDAAYRHIHQECQIEIMDYSAVRSTSRKMNNEEFVKLMNMGSQEPPPREPWVKVRWINIGGVSWDVIKALSIKYHLHPLALEDVFHGHKGNRSKADYYTKHLFLRVLCHELVEDDDLPTNSLGSFTDAPRSSSPEPISYFSPEDGDKTIDNSTEELAKSGGISTSFSSIAKRPLSRRSPILPTTRVNSGRPTYTRNSIPKEFSIMAAKEAALQAQSAERKEDEAAVRTLKKGSRVNVAVSPMFFFLFRDGTVISIRSVPNLNFTIPIAYRLNSRDTVMRKSADPSLLLHALLDLIVDNAIQVIDRYHVKIHKYELQILLQPNMETVKELHILSGDLILHKRTLDPIKTMIFGLRRYDVDRCAALIDTSDPANKDIKIVGFMSHKAKIYLADVYDHMEYILTSLDMFAGIADNLINYSFNIASYEMNEVMRRLTIATIIFLPLTVLTGYFGMNFPAMWSLHHTDLFFWELALPIMVFVVPIALIGDLKKFWHYMQKKRDIKVR